MIRTATIAAGISLLAALPASAATYVGTLYGIITSGTAYYSEPDPDNEPYYLHSQVDLIGKPITIDFTANVTNNYFDTDDYIFYKRYVTSSIRVQIPIPGSIADYSSFPTNNFYRPPSDADFTGTAASGSYSGFGLMEGEPDFPQRLVFTFANAGSTLGPLTGSGGAAASFYDPYNGVTQSYGFVNSDYYSVITFNLLRGSVTGPGADTPEPASWALMVVGFGLIGAALRRRHGQPEDVSTART